MKTRNGKKPIRVHLLNGDSVLLVFEVSTTFHFFYKSILTVSIVVSKP